MLTPDGWPMGVFLFDRDHKETDAQPKVKQLPFGRPFCFLTFLSSREYPKLASQATGFW